MKELNSAVVVGKTLKAKSPDNEMGAFYSIDKAWKKM